LIKGLYEDSEQAKPIVQTLLSSPK